jgi:hypothetical protein
MNPNVEVRVITYLARKSEFDFCLRVNVLGSSLSLLTALPKTGTQDLANGSTGLRCQAKKAADVMRGNDAYAVQVQHLIPNGHANSPITVIRQLKPTKGQVLKGEIRLGVVGRLNP